MWRERWRCLCIESHQVDIGINGCCGRVCEQGKRLFISFWVWVYAYECGKTGVCVYGETGLCLCMCVEVERGVCV